MMQQLDGNQQNDVIDSLAKRDDQSISSSSSNSLSEDENYYSNFLLVPVARSFSLHTDPVYGEAATRHDSISTSARTAITSNIRWQSTVLSRDCLSPPNCIDADDDINQTRSIFGNNIQKKYYLRRGEILETYCNQIVNQASNSSHVETSACFIPATLSEKKLGTEIRLANEETLLSSALPETPGTIHGVYSSPIQLYYAYTGSNDINKFHRNLTIPTQQHHQQQKHQHAQRFIKWLGFFLLLLLLFVIWLVLCRP